MNTHLEIIMGAAPTELLPKTIANAATYRDAAQDLHDRIVQEPTPDLTQAKTPSDIPKIHASLMAYETQEPRRNHAATILKDAEARLQLARLVAAPDLEPHFAEQFDTAAAEFTAALEAIGDADPDLLITEHWRPEGERLRAATAQLDDLARVRKAFALLHGRRHSEIMSHEYEEDSRTAYFDSRASAFEFHQRLRLRNNHWTTLAGTPGAVIKWQTRAQQETHPSSASVTKRDRVLADQLNR